MTILPELPRKKKSTYIVGDVIFRQVFITQWVGQFQEDFRGGKVVAMDTAYKLYLWMTCHMTPRLSAEFQNPQVSTTVSFPDAKKKIIKS